MILCVYCKVLKGTVQRDLQPSVFLRQVRIRKKTEGQKSRWTVPLNGRARRSVVVQGQLSPKVGSGHD